MGTDYWILSVDGGATKTDALLVNVGKLKGVLATGKGSNPNVYGKTGLVNLVNLIDDTLEAAKTSREGIRESIVGMAGISSPKYRGHIESQLASVLPEAGLILTSDAELAHRCIWGIAEGITLIVGTGSIALGTDPLGNVRRSGGLGYQTGDEGSGYWLGKMLLTELIASERSTADDVVQLKDQVLKASESTTFENAVAFFSGEERSVSRVASLALVALSSAEKGNILTTRMVSRGVEALASLIEDLAEKLGAKEGNLSLGVSGSVITESSFYRDLLKDQLLFQFDSVEWVRSDFLPVYGGLVLSKREIKPKEFSRITIDHA